MKFLFLLFQLQKKKHWDILYFSEVLIWTKYTHSQLQCCRHFLPKSQSSVLRSWLQRDNYSFLIIPSQSELWHPRFLEATHVIVHLEREWLALGPSIRFCVQEPLLASAGLVLCSGARLGLLPLHCFRVGKGNLWARQLAYYLAEWEVVRIQHHRPGKPIRRLLMRFSPQGDYSPSAFGPGISTCSATNIQLHILKRSLMILYIDSNSYASLVVLWLGFLSVYFLDLGSRIILCLIYISVI